MLPEIQIFPQRAVKNRRILGNIAQILIEAVQTDVMKLHAVQPDASRFIFQETAEQLCQSGFSGTALSHQSHLFSRPYGELQIPEDLAVCIGKVQAADPDFSAQAIQSSSPLQLFILRSMQEFLQAAPSGHIQPVLDQKHIENGDGRINIIHQRDEGNHFPHGKSASQPCISQDTQLHGGHNERENHEKGLMDHSHPGLDLNSLVPRPARFCQFSGKPPLHSENHHLHEAPDQKMIRPLLIGKQAFLHPVQHL